MAELDTISKQNLDRNAHFSGSYETYFYIILGLCLAFIVLIIVLLAIYCARKKTATSDDKNLPIQRPENEPEPLDNEIESVEKSVLEPLPYSIKPPGVTEFPKKFAKAYSKGQEISKA